ncbi:nuclear transport factor 2 family protein [Klebsiella sp. CN_Kp098]|uniref:nuclear transport factor 2 family protein n=1 Tax=unclassified Klebsiella TaxID=2608929 RepID=UPI0032B4F90E
MNQTVDALCHELNPKDESAVTKLLAQYGPAFDHGKADAYALLFTQDGQLSFPDGKGGTTVIKGRVALAKFTEQAYKSSYETGASGVHFAGKTILVQISHDTIHAYTPVTMILLQENAQPAASIMSVGQYVDVIKKVEGEWLFASRTADSYITGPLPAEFLPPNE